MAKNHRQIQNCQRCFIAVISLFVFAGNLHAAPGKVPSAVHALMKQHCLDCHDSETQEGQIRLDSLSQLEPGGRLELLNKIEEQIYLKQMPPKTEKPLAASDREALLEWITADFKALNSQSSFRQKLRDPYYGNYVDHEQLFSGEIEDKPFSPARRWIVSPHIFHSRIHRIYRTTHPQHKLTLPSGVANPFRLPDGSGVRYYDDTQVGSGHFQTMLVNAEVISYAQLGILPPRDRRANEDMARKLEVELAKIDRMDIPEDGKGGKKQLRSKLRGRFRAKTPVKIGYRMPSGPTPFEVILQKTTAPSESEIEAAIQFQYSIVHQRAADEKEVASLKTLALETIGKLGNAEGLRRMLVAVLLQPELVYRNEFGAGEEDEHGRRKLSPREAAYAIAYALTEQDPDEILMTAAREGKLSTKEEYEQQVVRLLKPTEEPQIVDHIDSRINFKTTQLAKLRFFRDFFGYANAKTIFKDNIRFEQGYFAEAIVPMIREADMQVDRILAKDQDVFHELLTTENFYLYHNGDNEAAVEAVEKAKEPVQRLLDDFPGKVQSREEAQAFGQKHKAAAGIMRLGYRGREWHIIRHTIVRVWNERLPLLKAIDDYNPPIDPGGGFHGSINRTNMFNIDHITWSYEPVQPFKIPNRKGMLTHPTWLVAHSQNTVTDPVRRGKWVREKLLAGFIPDVPITVDASVPEDHNNTLRERLHSKTKAQFCWKCHEKMNPLGYAFEMYDDFGRFRTEEELEYPEHLVKKMPERGNYTRSSYKTLPLDTTGYLTGTGDPKLDGEVKDAIDLITRLSKSDRVRQSIIRHAFRYFMGRNEMLSDSQTLIDADQAYLSSGGSFNAVIVSLLTSDSFMYRK